MTSLATEAPASLATPSPRERLLLALPALLVLMVYGRLIGYGFAGWDETFTVEQNPRFHPATLDQLGWYWTHSQYGLYMPVTQTLWWALARVSSMAGAPAASPHLYHAANVVLHAIAALMLALLLRRLAGLWPAVVAAMLWALHPVQVESVGWVSGTKDVLAGLLCLCCWWAWCVAVEKKQIRWRLAAYGCFVLAMLSKPTAVMALPALAVIDHWLLGRPWPVVGRQLSIWLLAAVPIALLARHVQTTPDIDAGPLLQRPIVALDSIAFYAWKTVWPLDLANDYARTPAWLLSHEWSYLTAALGLALCLAAWISRSRAVWSAVAIFLLCLLPVLGLTAFQNQRFSTVTDHYLYLPLAGLAIALASGCRNLALRRVAMLATVPLAVLTFLQCGIWRDGITLFSHTVSVSPRSGMALSNLGTQYAIRGLATENLEDFRTAVQLERLAVARLPDNAAAWKQLAMASAIIGNVDDAEHAFTQYQVLIDADPNIAETGRAQARYVAADHLAWAGRTEPALRWLREAISLDPQLTDARNLLSTLEANPAPQSPASQPVSSDSDE